MKKKREELVDVIHIGFIKTGSTWLQSSILPNIDGLSVIGKPYLISEKFQPMLAEIITKNSYEFDAREYRNRLRHLIDTHLSDVQKKNVKMISHDLWSGDVFSGINSKEIIDRIYSCFGKVKIVLVVREQRSIIESWYKHYLTAGGSLHIRDFMYRRVSPSVGPMRNRYMFSKFKYDQIISYLIEKFGKQRVKILFYERLKKSPVSFADELFRFVGVESPSEKSLRKNHKNVSLSPSVLKALRLFNQVVATPFSDSPFLRPFEYKYYAFTHKIVRPINNLFLSSVLRNKKFIDTDKYWWWEKIAMKINSKIKKGDMNLRIADEIVEHYRESNSNLERILGVDLAELGYETQSKMR